MARQQVLAEPCREHPERFVRGTSAVPALPEAVRINPPDHPSLTHEKLTDFQTEMSHCTRHIPEFFILSYPAFRNAKSNTFMPARITRFSSSVLRIRFSHLSKYLGRK